MKSTEEIVSDVLAKSGREARGSVPFEIFRCESKIEEIMFYAFWSRGVWQERMRIVAPCNAVQLCSEAGNWGEFHNPIVMCPQMQVNDYRADFGLAVEGSDNFAMVAIVECDGHDFHEKTKEQAARDKARDRFFVSADIRVFRFTGSEIWKDAGKCACEVMNVMENWVAAQFDRKLAQTREARPS